MIFIPVGANQYEVWVGEKFISRNSFDPSLIFPGSEVKSVLLADGTRFDRTLSSVLDLHYPPFLCCDGINIDLTENDLQALRNIGVDTSHTYPEFHKEK